MSDFKFVLNREGVRELMQSQEMQDVLVDFASQVAERAGDGYDVSATEILSMGLEKIYRDPKGFYDTDREYFDFVVNLVQGAL